MSPKEARRPTAFPLDEVRVTGPDETGPDLLGRTQVAIAEQPDLFEGAAASLPVPVAAAPSRRWGRLFAGAAGGLVLLALGLAVDSLIRELFQRNDWLGWLAVALAGLAGLALLVLAGREIAGLLRLRKINHIHAKAVDAAAADDRRAALGVIGELQSLYRGRPDTARGRAALAGHAAEIIDGRDLLGLAERELLLPLDETARRMVLSSAKRVALVTAVSPRALVDVIFVGAEILRLIRRLGTLYGGRPGTLGFLRLARAAIAHLAVTGGIAAGDSIVQQLLGHGIAARLSARLGEGVVNGMLTARVGIAATEVCRPLPFVTGRAPRLSDVMSELTRLSGKS
jgi:putative membrane protein